jgi:hypothetical protein
VIRLKLKKTKRVPIVFQLPPKTVHIFEPFNLPVGTSSSLIKRTVYTKRTRNPANWNWHLRWFKHCLVHNEWNPAIKEGWIADAFIFWATGQMTSERYAPEEDSAIPAFWDHIRHL